MASLGFTVGKIRRLRKIAEAKYAWPGGYVIYFVTHDGEALCCDCVMDKDNPCHIKDDEDGWGIAGWHLQYCGEPPEFCGHCGEQL